MKTARLSTASGAIFLAACAIARADDGVPVAAPVTPPAASAPAPVVRSAPARDDTVAPSVAPWTDPAVAAQEIEAFNADPDKMVEQMHEITEREQEIADRQRNEQIDQQQAYASDWLLRDYTETLKRNHLEKSTYTNPYLVPPPPNADGTPATPSTDPLLAPQTKTESDRDPFRTPEDTQPLTPKKSLAPIGFAPLLPPLTPNSSAPDRHDPWSGSALGGDMTSLPDATAASLLPVPKMHPIARSNETPADAGLPLLDVPGLTAAAQDNPIAMNNALVFQDPGQEQPGARARRNAADNILMPTAPLNDVDEFFKRQAESLQPPLAPGMTRPVAAPVKPMVIETPKITVRPPMSGIRTHVDDPFDILKR